MSRHTYLRILNEEIQKLNGVIDYKIIHDYDYRREARRHKQLLKKVRKEQTGRMLARMFDLLSLRWR